MTKDLFLQGMSRAACTVSLVTTDGPAGRGGATVSTLTSVSADGVRPSLLVCMHHLSHAAGAVHRNRVFCVNILREEHAELSDVFAGRSQVHSDKKFEYANWHTFKTGSPILSDALVAFDCELKSEMQYGTHWIFIGEVADLKLSKPGLPLLYANHSYGIPATL
ncbi:flavin reductase family protein [Hyphomicrobium sp.]|uniref:flavin reductase family protein n=1 Tax=Hyphomicrobium sp. TaxID=82 RepID=UPI001E04A50F|nr:flavin reductase family protein [Hyphomicrobium sp.]MBY0558781.1 flavin reductase family protein [Hyphomicrobium sp.]